MVAHRSGMILLDTCIVLRICDGLPLPEPLRQDMASTPWAVSSVTAWEIAIKHALGKLPLGDAPERWWPGVVQALSLHVESFSDAHALRAGALPNLHGDPFDRAIIATGVDLGWPVATIDPTFLAYREPCGLQLLG